MNALFDRFVRLEVGFLGRRESAYLAWGKVGIIVAVTLGIVLTWHAGLSLPVILVLSAASVAALLGQTLIMKALTGREELVYYRHEVAILAVAAITLRALGQPIWPYLDITILAVGAFLVCGRIGCLMVGCCHGRPGAWGPRYSHQHVAAGFTHYYAGIRLFPIQIVESIWVLVSVAVGTSMIWRGSAPGEAFAWYVIVYDVGRFSFEFVRGDTGRPYAGGYSEAQWTSALLMLIVVGAEAAGALPFHRWHWIATASVIIAWIAVAGLRPSSPLARHRLLDPDHVSEIARALEVNDPANDVAAGAVHISRTSLGVQISSGRPRGGFDPSPHHYTLSWSDGELSADAARTLADLILLLQRESAPHELATGTHGVYHLVVGAAAGFRAAGSPKTLT